uniref:Uncharacterized protein n=1 Tax=Anopheles atroparvus TaxID=41427 RepID=A0A182JA18_ANOAO
MEHRRQAAGTIALLCGLVSFLAGLAEANDGTGRLIALTPSDSTGSQQLCQDLCGECQCSGQLVGENVCLCNCDFPSASAGGSNCTVKVKRLCQQMDVECDFNGPEITYVRAGRGCHSMSCHEKHHGHDEGHEGYYGVDEEGGEYEEGYGHGAKELICCKDKKHKEKKHKHKHKKHHKKEKHSKFHIIIKGKIPEQQCHHEGDDHYGGYEEHEGYRAVAPMNRQPSPFGGHGPMEVTVWKNGKKQPLRGPPHQQQHQHPPHHQQQHQQPPKHYSHAVPPPESGPRGKSSEPPHPPPPREQPPQRPHPPAPAEPELPPGEPLTPPPNLFDGAPVAPDQRPPARVEPPKSHTTQSPPPQAPKAPPPPPAFLRPAPPPPPPPPSFYRPAPPPPPPPAPRRMEPSYSSCQLDSYDLNYFHPPQFYSAPPPPPPPKPPTPPPQSSFYRSSSSRSFDPYSSSYYQPQYETPKHYPEYDEPASYGEHDDSYGHDGPPSYGHGVHPLSDDEVEDWPPPPMRDPADILAFNQIVSRQIWQNERAILYSTPPFQPTPRPLRDEFEPPAAEIAPVQYEAGGSGEKNYYMDFPLAPPADAFIPPVPPPDSPVEFPTAEHMPVTYPGNSEEAQYRPPTPPPHYVRMKSAGRMTSFGFDRQSHGSGGYRSASHAGSQGHVWEKTTRSFIIEANPLVLAVRERHLLLGVPHEGRVVHAEEGADLVVAQEARLVGELAGKSAARRRGSDVELRLVDERERAAVGGHADEQLLLGRTLFHPLARTVVDGQLLLVVGGRVEREQRRIVADLALPLAVEVVRHHVDEVEVLGDLRHVVPGSDGLEGGGHGSGQQEARLSGRLRFALERDAQLTQQIDVGLAIVGTARILPVDVEPVKLIVAQELDRLVHELIHAEHVRPATVDQSTSFASLPRLTPRSSSRIAPISGYFTLPPQTVPLKSSMSTVHTIAPPKPFVLIQVILLRMARSSSKPTHWSPSTRYGTFISSSQT